MTTLDPSDLNAVARLVMASERCGPQLLDDSAEVAAVVQASEDLEAVMVLLARSSLRSFTSDDQW
jgi:hypothetical protein